MFVEKVHSRIINGENKESADRNGEKRRVINSEIQGKDIKEKTFTEMRDSA